MTVALEGVPVVYLGHLVLDGDGQIGLVLHQHLHHMMHQLCLRIIAVIEQNIAGAAAAIGQQQTEGHHNGRHGNPHLFGPALGFAHLALEPAHHQVQHHCDDHQHTSGGQDQRHVRDTDCLGNNTAQAAAAHKGREHGGADGVHHRDADASKHRRKRQGEFHHQNPVRLAHAHAPGRLLHAWVHLLKAQAGIAHDGQQGVEHDTDDHGGLSGVQHHHNDAE